MKVAMMFVVAAMMFSGINAQASSSQSSHSGLTDPNFNPNRTGPSDFITFQASCGAVITEPRATASPRDLQLALEQANSGHSAKANNSVQ